MSANIYDSGAHPMKSAIRYVVLILVGLILGMPLGIRLGHRSFDKGIEMFSDVLAWSEYETLAGIQYKESDIPHARQALLDLLKFMDETETKNKLELQRSAELDRGIAYMRLALLEEKAGNPSESTAYIHKAQAVLGKRENSEPSEELLRDEITRWDKTPTYKLPGMFLLSRQF
jgi:hypothetical protein